MTVLIVNYKARRFRKRAVLMIGLPVGLIGYAKCAFVKSRQALISTAALSRKKSVIIFCRKA